MKPADRVIMWIDGILALLGLGLIIANIIHAAMYGTFASPVALIGGVMTLGYGLYGFFKTKSKTTVKG